MTIEGIDSLSFLQPINNVLPGTLSGLDKAWNSIFSQLQKGLNLVPVGQPSGQSSQNLFKITEQILEKPIKVDPSKADLGFNVGKVGLATLPKAKGDVFEKIPALRQDFRGALKGLNKSYTSEFDTGAAAAKKTTVYGKK